MQGRAYEVVDYDRERRTITLCDPESAALLTIVCTDDTLINALDERKQHDAMGNDRA